MSKHSIVVAGIDTGKRKLDVALNDKPEQLEIANSTDGHKELATWLRRHRVKRVGIEASGGYEQDAVATLRRRGFVVVVLQPGQVRSYAKFCLQRAKNDHIDAALIAACTAALPPSKIYPPPDPRLVPLAAHLTLIDQLTDDIARLKTRRETCRDERLRRFWSEEVTRLKAIQRRETRELVAAIRRHADLGDRLDLIESVAGVGTKASIAILIRMPEIGRVSREAVAALAGLAPFDDNSADRIGAKHIEGGRERLRKTLYSATLSAAFHWNPQLIALYRRLAAQGKPHKVALIACARKLLVFVNAVVERGTPWVKQPAAA